MPGLSFSIHVLKTLAVVNKLNMGKDHGQSILAKSETLDPLDVFQITQ